jgi:hypothetical protein
VSPAALSDRWHLTLCRTLLKARLGNSALSIQFGKAVPWISPTYESATVISSADTVSVTVTLGNASALQTIAPYNSEQCRRQMRCVEGQHPPGCIPANITAGWAGYPANVGGDCGWAAIQSRDGGWANATVAAKGGQLVLEVPAELVKGDVVATSYGWSVYATVSTYTVDEVAGGGGGIPVLPWNRTLAA